MPVSKFSARRRMNGPMIGERGTCVALSPKRSAQHVTSKITAQFESLQKSLVETIEFMGMTVRFAQSLDLDQVVLKVGYGESVVIVNPYRECSFSFWSRKRTTSGDSINDPWTFHQVLGVLKIMSEEKRFQRLWTQIDFDVSTERCVCIAHLRERTKTAVVK